MRAFPVIYTSDPRSRVRHRRPTDTPWGERPAYVTDPDGNPVALAQAQ